MRHSVLVCTFPHKSGRCLRQRLQFHQSMRHSLSLEQDERLAEWHADDLVGFIAFVVGAVFLETFLMILVPCKSSHRLGIESVTTFQERKIG